MIHSLLKKVCSIIIPSAGRLAPRFGWSLGLSLGLAVSAQGWTTLPLPNLISSPPHFGALTMTHFPDGRFLLGNNNQLYTQNAFGAANVTAFPTISGDGVDPSFLAILSPHVAVAGAGQFGNTSLYQFDPTNPGAPGFKAFTATQNFSGVARNAAGVYVVGEDGSGGNNAVSYVTLSGKEQLLVNNDGAFSAGVTRDAMGDLFVADNDSDSVYEFTAAQIQRALATNATLTLGNGTLEHAFADDVVGSVAVDGQGRIWAAGFGADGLFWWDPKANTGGVLTPQDTGGAYNVNTFTRQGVTYVGYVWQAGFTTGDTVLYGYATTSTALAPAISQQPKAVTTARGQTAQFTVKAASPTPLKQAYAWQKNGMSLRNGAKVSGATTATLTVSNVAPGDAGQYRVVITNAEGSVTSNTVKLTVQP